MIIGHVAIGLSNSWVSSKPKSVLFARAWFSSTLAEKQAVEMPSIRNSDVQTGLSY